MLPFAGPLAREQRRRHRLRRGQRRHLVRDDEADHVRATGFDVGLDRGEPRDRLDHRIVNPLIGVRAAFAEAAYRNIDEVRLDRAQRRLADSHALGDAGAMVLHEQIGARDHPLEQFQAARIAQVERHRALVAVNHREGRCDAALRPAHRAREVADSRRFDFDHVGALIAENHRRHRPGKILRYVNDAKPAQWSVCGF